MLDDNFIISLKSNYNIFADPKKQQLAVVKSK